MQDLAEIVRRVHSDGKWWQFAFIYLVFFGFLAYLIYDRIKNGPHSDVIKWRLYISNLGDGYTGDDAYENVAGSDSPIGRVTSIQMPWYELTFETPWQTESGCIASVKVKAFGSLNSIENGPLLGSVPITIRFPNGRSTVGRLCTKWI